MSRRLTGCRIDCFRVKDPRVARCQPSDTDGGRLSTVQAACAPLSLSVIFTDCGGALEKKRLRVRGAGIGTFMQQVHRKKKPIQVSQTDKHHSLRDPREEIMDLLIHTPTDADHKISFHFAKLWAMSTRKRNTVLGLNH